jgi:hypothetical protein
MKNTFLSAAALALIAAPILAAPAFAATDADCSAMWVEADANADGTLTGVEAQKYGAMMRIAEKDMPADETMTEVMFKENCIADVFAVSTMDEGAPLEGANSFTENQATDRVIAAGMTEPSALIKDDQGIWRGTAMKDGKQMPVAVDFKGNVISK